ncbi:MAG: hypothetical protein KJP00_00910 [Bacteroidia bacterium]|nr:hypothetical protein [Bacteroidia bacterium]
MILKIRHIFLIGIIATVISCAKNEEEVIYIDSEIKPYFDRFAAEGEERGVTVDFIAARIEGYIEDVDETNILGQCERNSIDPDRLIMDKAYWISASDMDREFLVFHELGHCFLNRTHLDTSDSNGNCTSMMHSGTSGCQNRYNTNTRETYLDELFEN